MQLLHSNPYPVAEFASLSLLVEPPSSLEPVHPASASNAQDTQSTKGGGDPINDVNANTAAAAADEAAGPSKPSAASGAAACTLVGETLTVVSPLATSSATSAHYALEELHAYLSSIDAEERRAEEEFHARMQRRRERREKRRQKRQEQEEEEAGGGGGNGRAASQSQSQSRRGGTSSNNSSTNRRRHVDRGDSLQTLETLGTDYEEDDTDSEVEGGEQSGMSPEDKARQEEKNAEVLLAMLVAASEESKKREAEEKRRKESGGDDNEHNDDGAAPEHWYERHMRLRDAVGSDLLRDDGHALYGHHASYYSHHRRTSDVRVFRPQRSGGGMALHYIVVRDTVLVGRICGLLLGSAEATAASAAAAAASPKSSQGGAAASALRSGSSVSDGNANGKAVSFDTANPAAAYPTPAGPTISAAVLAVGVSGCNSILGTSELVPTLPLRFADSVALLQGLGVVSAKSVKAAAAAATSGGGSKYKATSANNLTNILSEARRYARSTLSALLLADADSIATNAMIDAERGALDDDDVQFFAESGPSSVKGSNRFRPGSAKGSSGVGSKKFGFSSNKLKRRSGAAASLSSGSRHSLSSSIGGGAGGSSRFGGAAWAASAGPAEKTRILFDQYQILGVAEDDMVIPPYQARARLEASGKLQRRKRYGRGLNPLDMGPIDLEAFAPPRKSPIGGRRPGGATGSVPPMMSPPKEAASTPRGGSSSLPPTGLSPNESGVGRSPLVSPTSRLSGPRRDTGRTGLRRAPSDRRKTSGRQQQQQQQSGDRTPPASAGEGAMDPFAFNEQSMPAQETAATFDPFAFDGAGDGWDVGAGGQGGHTAAATQGRGLVEATPIPLSTPQGVNAEGFFEDAPMSPHPPQQIPLSPGPESPEPSLNRLTRQSSQDAAATSALEAAIAATTISDPPVASPLQEAPATVRFQVSVALNEDLTCSYRDSKISSCSVDGMIQVQIKNVEGLGDAMAPDDEPPPFALYLRDPSRHIRSIQENKKYAGGYGAAVASITGENVANGSEHERKYVVTLPKTSSYFPVMKYKCSNDLRPVPIVSCLFIL